MISGYHSLYLEQTNYNIGNLRIGLKKQEVYYFK